MSAAPVVCRLLRSRSAYGHAPDGVDWRTGDSPTEAYWCVATQEPVGPDDGLVHAHACRAGRACFAAPAAELADEGGAGAPEAG